VKRLLLLLALLLLFTPQAANAQLSLTAYRDVVLSSTGTPITTAAITVFVPNTTTKVTIFSTTVGGTLANPFAVDSLGNYTFYAVPGVYDILISVPGLADTTIEDVHLASSSSYFLTGVTTEPSGCGVGGYYYNTTTGLYTLCGTAGISVPGASTLTGNITFGGSIIPLVTGQDICSSSLRCDAFLQAIDFSTTLDFPDPGGVNDRMAFHGIATTTIPTEASLGQNDHVFIQYADTASPLSIRHFIHRQLDPTISENEFLVGAYHHPAFTLDNIKGGVGGAASYVFRSKGISRWLLTSDPLDDDSFQWSLRQFPLDATRFRVNAVAAAVDIGVGIAAQIEQMGNTDTLGYLKSVAQQNDTTGRAAYALRNLAGDETWIRNAGGRVIEIASARDGGTTYYVIQNDGTGIIRAPASGFVDHSDGLKIGGGTELTTSNQTGTGNLVLVTSPTIVTPVIAAANPLEGALSNGPRWIFKQVDFGDMTAAATADTFTLWTLPANTIIHDVVGTVVTGWSGGTITAAICSVGTQAGSDNDLALDDDFFTTGTRYELHDATANGGKGTLLFDATDKFAPTMFVAGGVVEIQCDLTGDNHANATAGQARIYVLVSQPLANTTTEAN